MANDKKLDYPIYTLQEAQAVVATKTAPMVTKESIEAKIADIQYIYHAHLIICIITMKNGFMVNGQSAPADMRNYDTNVTKTYAYENAFKQLWVLEGYLLREKLHANDKTAFDTLPDDYEAPR